MFGREELIWEWSDDLDTGFKVYDMVQANEVMDRMEARIKELEEARIKELEAECEKHRKFEERLNAINKFFDSISSEEFNELLETKYGIPRNEDDSKNEDVSINEGDKD